MGVDLFYTVLFFFLVLALVLGSFVVREVSQGPYVLALAQTLLGTGGVLMGLSWLWYPRSGLAGVGYLLSSYLMSLGLPFENLLQSLKTLCAAAATGQPEQAEQLQALIQRQLTQITQRLNATLEKLRSPVSTHGDAVDAGEWWQALLQRYNGRRIDFHVNGAIGGIAIPAELFDSVADNLIENAFNESSEEQALEVSVTFSSAHAGTLTVCDNGAPVPGTVASQLFEDAVDSRTGLGMGLNQSSRFATQFGYRLKLVANSPARVCFVLSRAETDALA